MNAANNPQIEVLLEASARDERTLRFDLDDDEIFGFHVQQAIEKLFKALIAAHGETYSFTHDLRTLQSQLAALGELFPAFPLPLDDLSEYAVEARYDQGDPISIAKRADLRTAVQGLRVTIQRRVSELRARP